MSYSYDVQDLRDACEVLRQYSSQFQDNLTELGHGVTLTENWQGLSGDAFRTTLTNIQINVDTTKRWLDGVVPYMEDMADGVRDDDSKYAYDLTEAG